MGTVYEKNVDAIWDDLNELMSMELPGDMPVARHMWRPCMSWMNAVRPEHFGDGI